MEKSYKSLANMMIYAVAAVAVIYAVYLDLSVPLWAVVGFIAAVFAVSMFFNRG